MSNVLTKLVQNGTEYSLPKEIYIIPESVITKGTTKTYGVEPYNTSYYYTDFTINAAAGVKWEEGKQYLINWDSMTVSSSYRNVRFRIGTGSYIPLMSSGGVILAGSTYCKKSYTRPYYYSTKYQSGGALHLLEDDNTTYSSMSADEGKTGTATTARSITAANLKTIIEYHAGNLDASKADDNAVVKLTGDQTIAGTKTFSTSPVVPSKTADATNTGTAIATEAQVYKKQDTLVSGTNIKTINNTSLLGSGDITIESGPTYTAGKNISISSNTINSDSTSILTQTEYNNLPSSKTSDDKTYFICETIS